MDGWMDARVTLKGDRHFSGLTGCNIDHAVEGCTPTVVPRNFPSTGVNVTEFMKTE